MKIVKRFSALDVDLTDLDEESVIKMANLQGTRFSTMIISIFPVLMIYPFIQKYFVKGIRLGSIKG
jgi:putative aldouronate transport system permease protein